MRGGTVSCTIAPHLHRRLLEVAGEYEASLFMVLHAALAVLLARASGATDVTIGSPVSGRGEAELDDLVGMFVNTLVLRSRVDHGGTFSDLLAHTAPPTWRPSATPTCRSSVWSRCSTRPARRRTRRCSR